MAGFLHKLKWYTFDKVITPWNLFRLRRKKKIRVLFILTELSIWKSERLYLKMREHPRFEPILGITPTIADSKDHYDNMLAYCREKKYPFVEISQDKTLVSQTDADILLYPQPYQGIYYPFHRMVRNYRALFLCVPYAMHTILEDWSINNMYYVHCWQYYFENEITADEYRQRMENGGRNLVVTGLPVMDDFLDEDKCGENPWKNNSPKKRIIYAPHHTINNKENRNLKGINYATILEFGDFMLDMAKKYKDKVHFAFKPHPYLKKKLIKVWGEERTEAYYREWEEMENSQLESGQYIGLFTYSDAMIHDCSSFTVEYFYAHRPVMYLVKDSHHAENGTKMLKEAFRLHYHGHNQEEIEQFIQNVINGKDVMSEERETFYKNYLVPPSDKSACDNIIDAILTKMLYH